MVLAQCANGIRFHTVGGLNLEEQKLAIYARGVHARAAIGTLKCLVQTHVSPVDLCISVFRAIYIFGLEGSQSPKVTHRS